MGMTGAHVTKWKKGSTPNDSTMLKIAEYFHVALGYLKGEDETVPFTFNFPLVRSSDDPETKIAAPIRAAINAVCEEYGLDPTCGFMRLLISNIAWDGDEPMKELIKAGQAAPEKVVKAATAVVKIMTDSE